MQDEVRKRGREGRWAGGRAGRTGGEGSSGGNLEVNHPHPQTTGSRSPGSVHRLVDPLPAPPTPIQRGWSQVDEGGWGVHRPVKCFLLEN